MTGASKASSKVDHSHLHTTHRAGRAGENILGVPEELEQEAAEDVWASVVNPTLEQMI